MHTNLKIKFVFGSLWNFFPFEQRVNIFSKFTHNNTEFEGIIPLYGRNTCCETRVLFFLRISVFFVAARKTLNIYKLGAEWMKIV